LQGRIRAGNACRRGGDFIGCLHEKEYDDDRTQYDPEKP
jgi:hypothetical protein